MGNDTFTYNPDKYDKPSVTVDTVCLRIRKADDSDNRRSGKSRLQVLLVKRSDEPYRDFWALPGTFVGMDEELDECARRGLKEKTDIDLDALYTEQLYTFGDVERDPRMRIVSVSYLGLLSQSSHVSKSAGRGVDSVAWCDVSWKGDGSFEVVRHPRKDEDGEPENITENIAFDHEKVLSTALSRIVNKLAYTDIAFKLLPDEFTLGEAQDAYETLLGKEMDKSNFRKFIKKFVEDTGKLESGVAHRPSRLYCLNPDWCDVPWR